MRPRGNRKTRAGGDTRHMPDQFVTANGSKKAGAFPCTIEQFLLNQKLLPRSVVVEHNGHAVAPSQFATRLVNAGDTLEIVRIVAGG